MPFVDMSDEEISMAALAVTEAARVSEKARRFATAKFEYDLAAKLWGEVGSMACSADCKASITRCDEARKAPPTGYFPAGA